MERRRRSLRKFLDVHDACYGLILLRRFELVKQMWEVLLDQLPHSRLNLYPIAFLEEAP